MTPRLAAAAEAFRYEHNLITAEETERWLEERGLSLDDFTDYFVRQYWGKTIDDVEGEQIEYASAPNELQELFVVELVLSGEMDRLAKRLSWRVAGKLESGNNDLGPESIAAERNRFLERSGTNEETLPVWLNAIGRDEEWFAHAVVMEALHRQKRDRLLSHRAREHEMAAMRLPLTRIELETMEVDSLDAAREALLCVREDGMSMKDVADEARYPYRRAEVLLEDLPEDLQQKFLSVSAGDVLEPITRGDGFQVCRVIEKAEPKAEDEAVRDRAEKRILERHFSELDRKTYSVAPVFGFSQMKASDDALLRRSALFRFLPDEHFEKILPLLQEEQYEFGDLIVRQGDPADAFYILVSGRARVVKSDQNGNEIALAALKPGDSFGEAALVARRHAHRDGALQHGGGSSSA